MPFIELNSTFNLVQLGQNTIQYTEPLTETVSSLDSSEQNRTRPSVQSDQRAIHRELWRVEHAATAENGFTKVTEDYLNLCAALLSVLRILNILCLILSWNSSAMQLVVADSIGFCHRLLQFIPRSALNIDTTAKLS